MPPSSSEENPSEVPKMESIRNVVKGERKGISIPYLPSLHSGFKVLEKNRRELESKKSLRENQHQEKLAQAAKRRHDLDSAYIDVLSRRKADAKMKQEREERENRENREALEAIEKKKDLIDSIDFPDSKKRKPRSLVVSEAVDSSIQRSPGHVRRGPKSFSTVGGYDGDIPEAIDQMYEVKEGDEDENLPTAETPVSAFFPAPENYLHVEANRFVYQNFDQDVDTSSSSDLIIEKAMKILDQHKSKFAR